MLAVILWRSSSYLHVPAVLCRCINSKGSRSDYCIGYTLREPVGQAYLAKSKQIGPMLKVVALVLPEQVGVHGGATSAIIGI